LLIAARSAICGRAHDMNGRGGQSCTYSRARVGLGLGA
jgi:hypothetical protein